MILSKKKVSIFQSLEIIMIDELIYSSFAKDITRQEGREHRLSVAFESLNLLGKHSYWKRAIFIQESSF